MKCTSKSGKTVSLQARGIKPGPFRVRITGLGTWRARIWFRTQGVSDSILRPP